MARLVVIDNYDSFTYNLVQYFEVLGARCQVYYNDALDAASVRAMAPDGIVISPGPCTPNEAGVSLSLISEAAGKIPILGVCLGHQAIGQVYGATIVGAAELMHGKTSPVDHDGSGVFAGLPSPLTATRYHSLTIDPATVPDELAVTATTADGTIMGVRHRHHDVEGVQFHPESVLTACGHDLLRTWLARCAQARFSPTVR
jgi:anthranilate synthase/aminodeoxychorismate synthase-like glutamine amidotransferase